MFKKGKLYINERKTVIVLCCSTSRRINKFTGVVVWSEDIDFKQGHYSRTWVSDRFKEHTSSIDLKSIN